MNNRAPNILLEERADLVKQIRGSQDFARREDLQARIDGIDLELNRRNNLDRIDQISSALAGLGAESLACSPGPTVHTVCIWIDREFGVYRTLDVVDALVRLPLNFTLVEVRRILHRLVATDLAARRI